MREKLLVENKSFAFETVLSTDRNLNFLKRAKDKDYFIMTNDVNINISRIEQRVAKGGHGVPVEKIKSRFNESIDNLKKLIEISDVCNVYDNSNTNIKRIFKKRKDVNYYNETYYWSKEKIMRLTGVEVMIEKDLNIFN